MSVSIIVGGQFGSEGKGKVSYYFAKKLEASVVVRVGGCNSGHTVVDDKKGEFILRILPTASIDEGIVSILPSGSYIDIDILQKEITKTQIKDNNLKIDPYAMIIDENMKSEEIGADLQNKIGSTLSGTGQAVIERLKRISDIKFAKDCDILSKYICDTKGFLRELLNQDKKIVIEGTQGFGLSPINSTFYPYCTSRDTTAAGFLMETGLSPFDVENIIMVIRAFPIRVGGNSGPLQNELCWEQISASSGANIDLTEYTSATLRIRRVAEFDAEIVRKAIEVNNPNIIVMNHLDYIDYSCNNCTVLSDKIINYIYNIEASINSKIDYAGTGKNICIQL